MWLTWLAESAESAQPATAAGSGAMISAVLPAAPSRGKIVPPAGRAGVRVGVRTVSRPVATVTWQRCS